MIKPKETERCGTLLFCLSFELYFALIQCVAVGSSLYFTCERAHATTHTWFRHEHESQARFTLDFTCCLHYASGVDSLLKKLKTKKTHY